MMDMNMNASTGIELREHIAEVRSGRGGAGLARIAPGLVRVTSDRRWGDALATSERPATSRPRLERSAFFTGIDAGRPFFRGQEITPGVAAQMARLGVTVEQALAQGGRESLVAVGSLNDVERQAAAQVGVTEEQFAATKLASGGHARPSPTSRNGLTEAERHAAAACGVTEEAFAATKARNCGTR